MPHYLGSALIAAQNAAILAALYLLVLIAITSYIAHSRCINSDKFWRLATLVAELCSAFGLIGLLTFGGRAFVEDHRRVLISNVAKSEAEASEALNVIGLNFCMNPSQPPRVFLGSGHTDQICRTWRESRIYSPQVDWDQVIETFRSFGNARDSDTLMRPAVYIASQKIKAMQNARRARDFEKEWGDTLRPTTSWTFVFFAAGLVGLGVSIKCAKAWKEFMRKSAS